MIPLSSKIFRGACLFTAVANMGGNLGLLLFYRPLFALLRVPMPADPYTFAATSLLSFTMGIVALFVFLNPEKNADMLKIGIAGKGLFAVVTCYFYAAHDLHWFWLLFGVYDALFVGVFFLYLMTLVSPDLVKMQRGDLSESIRREPSSRALVIAFSLTGNGGKAVARLKRGLEQGGYEVDVKNAESQEELFRFPMSFIDFCKIIVRAAFRVRTTSAPLDVADDKDYDLVVVEAQTWLLGMAAPIEAIFFDPANARVFSGRDAAALVVCRGAWRRTQAMLVRRLEGAGANVVAARGYIHKGSEPLRLFMLWFYLIFKGKGWVQSLYGLSEETLQQIEVYGSDLARRHRPSAARTSRVTPEYGRAAALAANSTSGVRPLVDDAQDVARQPAGGAR